MSIYNEFAYIYHIGPYTAYSLRMAELLPSVLANFNCQPQTILDLACGEGSFAIRQAKMGRSVTGVDMSPRMLQIARIQATEQGVNTEFIEMDIRNLNFANSFDLATCWFDSLNYLLELDDLAQAFQCVQKSLKPGGLFIFDMNTIYGLAVLWQQQVYTIQQDTPDLVEIHRSSFDYDRSIATVSITAFIRADLGWQRMDEIHQERGYPVGQIHDLLGECGFEFLACYGNLADMSEPEPDSGRVWFVARKGETQAEGGKMKSIPSGRKHAFKGHQSRKTHH